MKEKIWYLKKIDIFSNLNRDEMEYISSNFKDTDYSKGDVIYSPIDEEDNSDIYFIKSGAVKLYRVDETGKELIYAVLNKNEMFGGILQIKATEGEFAESIMDTVVCRINKDTFFSFINKNPSLVIKLNKFLGLRVVKLEVMIENLVFKPVLFRLAVVLHTLADKFGEKKGGSTLIKLNLTHNDIASMIGATRETTTLALNKLKAQKIIEIDKKMLSVKNYPKLCDIVDCNSDYSKIF